MNENAHTARSDDEETSEPGGGGPIPADDLTQEELREAERLGDGSPAVEPRQPDE
jgi:hypothetical protein